MKTDHELLELAAKAAGFVRLKYFDDVPYVAHGIHGEDFFAWNPLADDGDALRLAVKLKLSIMYGDPGSVQVSADDGGEHCTAFAMEPVGDKPYASTRRAIVRAAAEIGRGA